MTLDGRVVIVTGATRGMGRSMALRFSLDGARVAAVGRTRDRLESLRAEVPGEVLAVSADVRRREAVERAVDRTVDEFGRIDALVNNAAVGLLSSEGELKPVTNVTESEWDMVLDTNLKGPFLFTKFVLPYMVEQGRGNVVNVSSAYGKHGEARWAPYVSSKHGLEGLTKTTALEHEDDGINVNAITPAGSVETRFWDTPEKRRNLPPEARTEIQDPDVMNDAMVLLAGQAAGGVTGESHPHTEWERKLGGNSRTN